MLGAIEFGKNIYSSFIIYKYWSLSYFWHLLSQIWLITVQSSSKAEKILLPLSKFEINILQLRIVLNLKMQDVSVFTWVGNALKKA